MSSLHLIVRTDASICSDEVAEFFKPSVEAIAQAFEQQQKAIAEEFEQQQKAAFIPVKVISSIRNELIT